MHSADAQPPTKPTFLSQYESKQFDLDRPPAKWEPWLEPYRTKGKRARRRDAAAAVKLDEEGAAAAALHQGPAAAAIATVTAGKPSAR